MDDSAQPPIRPLQPLAVRVKEACRLTGIGRSKLYLLISEGHIETIKLGSMTLIPMTSLERLLKKERYVAGK
ncbi:MAG: helix-turn-helix domain-containing protein [Alphaproteobacteria bacterium]|nr:MAG: helix-turn-helix domain-containing protein [Alphaproteobacteria bacterium]